MRYIEVTFRPSPCTETITDVLAAVLADAGFESFVPSDEGLVAYIQQQFLQEESLKEVLGSFPIEGITFEYTQAEAEDKDWNEEWEKNYFQPIVIDNRCVVHSTFHRDIPQMEYDIVINPQMAFGTGHHETTSLIASELLQADLEGKCVLDMGCGTSILAILARMRGAFAVTAIDIDTWCVNNSLENIRLNGLSHIGVELGDAAVLQGKGPFDIVIANINRNILLRDMISYISCMRKGSEMYISGFYVEDIPVLREKAEELGLTFVHHREKNNWATVKFTY